jgi:hypothetical protein
MPLGEVLTSDLDPISITIILISFIAFIILVEILLSLLERVRKRIKRTKIIDFISSLNVRLLIC